MDAFDDMEETIESDSLSTDIGWIISMHSTIHDKSALQEVKRSLKLAFAGRSLLNWATVALSTYEVCTARRCGIAVPIVCACG